MLTGRRPFAGEYDHALIYSILNSEPDLNAIEDSDASVIVDACLRKDRSERFASVGELADALAALKGGSGTGHIAVPRRRAIRSPLTLGLAASAVALILLVTWFMARLPAGSDGSVPPTPERQMLMVLPFENLGDPEDQYFAEGMAEELSIRLGSVQSLGVISRNTANRYRSTEKTAPEIGAEVGVDFIVGGTVRWSREPDGSRRVRISPYLTRVSDDLQLWAESYDRRLADVLDVQRDVASRWSEI